MYYTCMASPVGQLLLAGDDDGMKCIGFSSGKGTMEAKGDWIRNDEFFADAIRQLEEYFAGERRTFDLKLCPDGTEFQLKVLDALTRIPYGETRSYRDIAGMIDRPRAVRAVGAANGRNPLPIVIPCHRVIGADGSLTGFGGGIETKRFLLDLERRQQRLAI